MYGTRDAAQNWGYAYTQFMKEVGFIKGPSSPCVFWHPDRELRCVVHGDDFTVLGWEKELDWFWKAVSTKFQSKHRGRLGPKESDVRRSGYSTGSSRGMREESDMKQIRGTLKSACVR